MERTTQKDKLEQELGFLKESFDAEVISREEYEKGKERIEKRLKEIEAASEESADRKEENKKEQKEEQNKEENKDENQDEQEERQNKEENKDRQKVEQPAKKEEQQKPGEKIRLKVIQDEDRGEDVGQQHAQHAQHVPQAASQAEPHAEKPSPSKYDIEPVPAPYPDADYQSKTSKAEKKGQKRKWGLFSYAAGFAVLAILIFISYSFLKWDAPNIQSNMQESLKISSDSNKFKIEPASEAASGTPKISVIVLNDRGRCFNCNTARVLSILEGWFGNMDIKEIDYSTDAGKEAAEKFGLSMLPAYILNESIEESESYNGIKQAFIKRGGKFIMSEDAAGSTLYFRRESVPNKLDFFVRENESAGVSAERNLKEFLANFNEAKYEKHMSKDNLTTELGIKTFPIFLLNNRIKLSGVLSPEAIKEGFCAVNNLESCDKKLSRALIVK